MMEGREALRVTLLEHLRRLKVTIPVMAHELQREARSRKVSGLIIRCISREHPCLIPTLTSFSLF